MKWNSLDTLSIVGFALMIAGVVLVYLHHALFSFSPPIIFIQVLAISLMIWARSTFGGRSFHASAGPTEGGLVTTGPYKYVRHPIYASVLLFVWAGILGNLSLGNIVFGLTTLSGAYVRIRCEEQLVRARYPEYDEYARKTKRLIPFVF